MSEYDELKRRLCAGWNTWDVSSMARHVLLPSGFTINLAFKKHWFGEIVREFRVSHDYPGEKQLAEAGIRTYDGRYTDLKIRTRHGDEWLARIQSAVVDGELVLLVTPLVPDSRSKLIVEAGFAWNRGGQVELRDSTLHGRPPSGEETALYSTRPAERGPQCAGLTPFMRFGLVGEIGLATNRPRPLDEIRAIIAVARKETESLHARYGDLAEAHEALQTVMAWNTVYDPVQDRVATVVDRHWACRWDGFVLFEWDTYFAARLATLDSEELAYANAIEITRAITDQGFVPNSVKGSGDKSYARSQPPVGALMALQIYGQYGKKWFLAEIYESLLRWNRWWPANRLKGELLAWGANDVSKSEDQFANSLQGAMYESGLDNSPMYDGVGFDGDLHVMQLQDVGLNSLYVADCRALAEIAGILGRVEEQAELELRGAQFAERIQASLWSEGAGIYLNWRTDRKEFSRRISPTNFYPLLAGIPSQAQAARMVKEHLLNDDEFGGEWLLPSIARNDPAYQDRVYWRGRIWPPMNYLVYLGLRNYDLPDTRKQLVGKSKALLLKEWREHRHVYENYCADTGQGGNHPVDDWYGTGSFYLWGGLLGLIAIIAAE